VLHLASTIHAQVAEEISVLDCVAALHPTPAVGGAPREAALAYLDRCEDLDRDRYAGPVGWFDATGDGEFYLGIRAAMLDGPSARLIAGAGIVAGSDPDSELAETQLKLQAFLAAAVRP
jgi:menaquinone-specific isochorismate synthase